MLSKKQFLFYAIGATIGWFALVAQFVLILQNSEVSALETIIRFFSFFTILTNTLVAIFFTTKLFPKSSLSAFFYRNGHSTAIAVYILIVGIIYHVLLRNIWNPQGLQKVVDQLLHTVMPLVFVLSWFLFEDKKSLGFKMIPAWLLYPICYAILVIIRGAISSYYPYPFVDVSILGYPTALQNTIGIFVAFSLVSAIFIAISKIFYARK